MTCTIFCFHQQCPRVPISLSFWQYLLFSVFFFFCFFDYRHPSGHGVVSHCDFDLHFPTDYLHFLGGASGKEPACQCRRWKRHEFDLWVGTIPWRRAWQPTPVFLPGESHGQRSLAENPMDRGARQFIGSRRVRRNWGGLAQHSY